MTTSSTDVLIIGAGPTGLTIANLLAYSGVRVRIVDKKAGISEETRALVVQSKTLELFNRFGLAEQVAATGQKLTGLRILNAGQHAKKLSFSSEVDRTPYPFALIYTQDQTEHLLLNHLEKTEVRVEWKTELLSLEQSASSTRAHIRRADGSEETIEAGWTVGADGAHSPVRHVLALDFSGESYKQALFLADVDLEGGVKDGEATIGFTRLGFMAFFPMPGKQRFRIVGTLPLELSERETLTPEEVQQVVNNYAGLHITLTKTRWISVYRTHHRMSERFRVGRIFLAGDAAHIHSPAGGQGMNTGIGDAFNLGWKLALVVKGQAHATLLDSYETERMPFARAILNGSDKGFELQTMSQPIAQNFKMFGIPKVFRLISDVPALRHWVYWYISQLWTSYRKSPAVAQSAPLKKAVQAGDRAPYGFYEVGPDAGKSIFTTLEGLDHHLLLFAGSKPEMTEAALQEIQARLRTLAAEYTVPLHLHFVAEGNHSLNKRYEADRPSVFLVRPDGHIAYRGLATDLESLRAYLGSLFESREARVHA